MTERYWRFLNSDIYALDNIFKIGAMNDIQSIALIT